MIKKNNYKIKQKKKILFFILFLFSIITLLKIFNFKNIINSELQGLQKTFTTYSTYFQLIDSGLQRLEGVQKKDYLVGIKNFSSTIYDEVFNNKPDLSTINIFIKFKHLKKIYDDRELSIKNNLNINPKYVPCKISNENEVYDCKIRLKGNLSDHWLEKTRFSLRVKIKDGYINGYKDFAIQKPRSRQFPYDQVFHYINNGSGGFSSSDQSFVNININNESWGVMNIEPVITDEYIESYKLKRAGVFRLTKKKIREFKSYIQNDYFISHKTINFFQRGNLSKKMEVKSAREIYSHIFHMRNSKNSLLYDRDKMIHSLMLSFVWGSAHTMNEGNTFYLWNNYTSKLEPFLADQSHWQNIEKTLSNYLSNIPDNFRLIFRDNPLNEKEYLSSLHKIENYLKYNDPVVITNKFKKKFFPNDRMFDSSPIYNNIKFLKNNSSLVIKSINKISKKELYHTITDKLEPLDLKLLKKDKDNLEFVKFFHFTDGNIKIFNLLSLPVYIKQIETNNQKIMINKTIPGSINNSLSSLEVKTNLIGKYDQKILAETIIEDFSNYARNDFSLISLADLRSEKNFDINKICKFKYQDNNCYISGEHIFTNTSIFKNKVIIEKDTKLKLLNNSDLIFESSVDINGNEDNPVSISGGKDGTGSIIIINKLNSISKINYTKFIDLTESSTPLRRYTGSVNGYGGKFEISNSTFINGDSEDQLNIVHSEIELSNVSFKNSKSDAFDCDFCDGEIVNVNFDKIGGDALDISGSNLDINFININSVYDKAISVGEGSRIRLKEANFNNVSTAVAVKDGSYASIENINLNNIINDAFMTYVKKPIFRGNTTLYVKNLKNISNLSGKKCVRNINTLISINSKICEISKINVDELYNEGRMKKK